MIFKLILSLLSVVISFSILCAVAHEETELVTGGVASCKLIGGNEKVSGNFKVRENSIILDDTDRHLEVALEGDSETSAGERSLEAEVEVIDVDSEDFEINKLLQTNANEANLLVTVDENNRKIAIISLSQDEDRNPLISSVKLLLTKIKSKTVSGVTTVNYPRTVTLPFSSAELAIIENEGNTELALEDATENGPVILKCRFRNLPFTLIGE